MKGFITRIYQLHMSAFNLLSSSNLISKLNFSTMLYLGLLFKSISHPFCPLLFFKVILSPYSSIMHKNFGETNFTELHMSILKDSRLKQY